MLLFARVTTGPVLDNGLPKEEQKRIRKARDSAPCSDGKVVEVGYRVDPFDKIVAAASRLQHAHRAKNPQFGAKWSEIANAIYDKEYKSASNDDWWQHYGAVGFGKVGVLNMMRLAPGERSLTPSSNSSAAVILGNLKLNSRSVKLCLTAQVRNDANDWSA